MKNCPQCNRPVEEAYMFCPWCGSAQPAPEQAAPAKADTGLPGLRFTQAQLETLRKLIGEVYLNPYRFSYSESEIRWARYTDGWGAHSANSQETEKLTILPVDLGQSLPDDLQPGFPPKDISFGQIFRHLADSARGSTEPLVWSASRRGFSREAAGRGIYVIASHTMAVRDPMGIGVDILVTYEAYSCR